MNLINHQINVNMEIMEIMNKTVKIMRMVMEKGRKRKGTVKVNWLLTKMMMMVTLTVTLSTVIVLLNVGRWV